MTVPQYRNIMHELMASPEVWDFEKRFSGAGRAGRNGKQFLETLARLPLRVWLGAGPIGFVVLAVLGFAVMRASPRSR